LIGILFIVTAKGLDEPLVSVVIPNYNYSRYLEKCLDSILSQSYSNLEVILVDDGSTDDSLEVAKKFREKITLCSQQNKGVNAARNLGIQKSSGAYIALCDSDDYWAPNKIEMQVEMIKKNSMIGLVYCSYYVVNEKEQELGIENASHSGKVADLFISLPTTAIICGGGSTALFSRSVLNKSLYFDESLRGNGEDWDFFRRLTQVACVAYVDSALAYIRKHDVSRGSRNLNHFYIGNKASVIKAAMDSYYSWTFIKRWKFFARFEFLMSKSYLRSRHFKHAVFHLMRIMFPYWLRKVGS